MNSVLATWSLRRIRKYVQFWWRLFRTTLDWTTILYFYLPGLALAGWFLATHYYAAGVLDHWYAVQTTAKQLLVVSAVNVAVVLVARSHFGTLTFSLNQGDRLYLMLAAIPKRRLLMQIWLEHLLFCWLFSMIAYLLTYPLLRTLGAVPLVWAVWCAVAASWFATIRLLSTLLAERILTWKGRFWFFVARYLSAVPVVWSVRWSADPGWHWRGVILLTLCLAVAVATAIPLGIRLTWNQFFVQSYSRLLNRFVFHYTDVKRKVRYQMKRPSQWLTRTVERMLRHHLHPVHWLILIRGLRRKNAVLYLALLSLLAVVAIKLPPGFFIKAVIAAMALFILNAWWKNLIEELFTDPIAEQFTVSRYQLQVVVQQLKFTCFAIVIAVWVIGYWLV